MRALVTGGAGFIGSHLADALVRRGDQVTVVDHLSRGHADNLDDAIAGGAALVRADVTDLAALTETFLGHRPDTVFHLAAQVDVRRSVADPAYDAHVNVGGTAAVLTAAHSAGVRRVVLASTAAVYGDPDTIPTTEAAAPAPLAPYGASKAAAESYLELFGRLYGMSTVTLRMSNVYGPRQSPHGEAGVIAIFCGLAATGGTATVFGDGRQSRDFVYVGDVVEAFVAAGDADAVGALNVSTRQETTLLDLVGALGLPTSDGPQRLGEIQRSCLDPGLAAERLGWRARTSLAEGLRPTLAALDKLARTT
jgi:UDP-glucose 4-epimerase